MNWNRPLPLLIPFSRTKQEIGIPKTRAYQLVAEGKLQRVHVDGRAYITGESAVAYVESLKAAAQIRGAAA